MNSLSENLKLRKTGSLLSVLMASLTLVTFALAMIAVPPCGPFCQENCIGYPYLDTLGQFPKDFLWLWLAPFQLGFFLVFCGLLYQKAGAEKKLYTLPGLLFGAIAAAILIMTYYVQGAVLPISLFKEEHDGLALFTMYNEHGIFIASEEIAYLLMAVSLYLFSAAFCKKDKNGLLLKWLFRLPLIVNLLSFILITLTFGLDRSYRFEIVTISVNWIVLIIAGYTMTAWLKSHSNTSES